MISLSWIRYPGSPAAGSTGSCSCSPSATRKIRYAVERAEQNGTSLGEEYFSAAPFSYLTGWNDQITLTKRPYTISDLINVFSAAGLWIETAIEPQLSEDARRRYPHKQAWMNKHLGILIFKLRPHSSQ